MENTIIATIGSTIIISGVIFYVTNQIKKLIETSKEHYNTEIDKLKKDILEKCQVNLEIITNDVEKLQNTIKQNNTNTEQQLNNILRNITNNIDKNYLSQNNMLNKLQDKQIEINQNNSKNQDEIKNILINTRDETLHCINTVRLSNYINTTNEISKYKNGIEENENYIKEVGFAKVIQITNKKDNEITKVNYINNNQYESKIFVDDVLKYLMKYENNTLVTSIEYDKNHNIIFEYTYNEVGEISLKLEYIYDKNNKQIDKIETKY